MEELFYESFPPVKNIVSCQILLIPNDTEMDLLYRKKVEGMKWWHLIKTGS